MGFRTVLCAAVLAAGSLRFRLRQASPVNAQTAGLQVALRATHLYAGPIDAIRGPATAQAVQAFQLRAGLSPDGVAGKQTRKALGVLGRPLFGNRTITRGDVGWDVAVLQFLLRRAGHASGVIDGTFGAKDGVRGSPVPARRRVAPGRRRGAADDRSARPSVPGPRRVAAGARRATHRARGGHAHRDRAALSHDRAAARARERSRSEPLPLRRCAAADSESQHPPRAGALRPVRRALVAFALVGALRRRCAPRACARVDGVRLQQRSRFVGGRHRRHAVAAAGRVGLRRDRARRQPRSRTRWTATSTPGSHTCTSSSPSSTATSTSHWVRGSRARTQCGSTACTPRRRRSLRTFLRSSRACSRIRLK